MQESLPKDRRATFIFTEAHVNSKTLLLLVFACTAAAHAQISLPAVLSSHMVVERDLPVHVWGIAAPGEDVSVSFRGETRTTTAGELGRWSVYLPPAGAGGPFQMSIKGTP